MKVGMISLGCPKNQVSAEQMLYLLREAGHEIVTDIDEAEAIVVNTCAFIEDAKQEAVNTILEAAGLKETGSAQVPHCRRLPQRSSSGAEILTEMPEADAVLGVGSCEEIADGPRPRRGGREARRHRRQLGARGRVPAHDKHRPGLGLPAHRRRLRQPLLLLPHTAAYAAASARARRRRCSPRRRSSQAGATASSYSSPRT